MSFAQKTSLTSGWALNKFAATLWASAAVGACAGSDLVVEAFVGTLFVLAANTLLRPVVNAINRRPIDDESTEVTYSVFVIAPRDQQKPARECLERILEAAQYPVPRAQIDGLLVR